MTDEKPPARITMNPFPRPGLTLPIPFLVKPKGCGAWIDPAMILAVVPEVDGACYIRLVGVDFGIYCESSADEVIEDIERLVNTTLQPLER